jgi:preprotein translocase subunit SecG
MYTFLLIILILDSVVLVASILLQAAKGGGLAASFGGVTTAADALIGTRQAGNFLTKTGWWAGGIFLSLAFILQIMSTRPQAPRSILDQPASPAPAPVQAGTPPATSAPAVPLEPAGKAAPVEKSPAPAQKAPAGTAKKP